MKRAGRITYTLISITISFVTTACTVNRGSLYVPSPIMAAKTQLSAGGYTVQWRGAGPDVELKIKLHRRVKATIPAKVIPLDRPLVEDEAVLSSDGDGGQRLLGIRFSGKKFFLHVEPQSASTSLADPPLLIPECEPALPW
jgi:hypothetical protein